MKGKKRKAPLDLVCEYCGRLCEAPGAGKELREHLVHFHGFSDSDAWEIVGVSMRIAKDERKLAEADL